MLCSDSVLTLKMIPLAFHFYHHFPTPHTENFKRILLGLTTAHSCLCRTVSLCVHMCAYVLTTMFTRAFGQRNLLCWNQNIPGDVCNSVAILTELKPAFSSYPSSAVGRLWTTQAAWYAEWQLSREVAWQPVISQKCLFSGICHISSLSLHFKMEKKDRNTDCL